MITMGAAALSCVVVLIILHRTKKYKIAAIFAVFLTFGINQSNLLIASNFSNFLNFFWIVIFALYTFFTLGKYWGISNLYVNILGVIIIFSLVKFDYLELIPKEYTTFSLVNFIVNSAFATLVFCYIILQMMKQMRLASEKYAAANKALTYRNEEKTVMLKEIHHRVKNNLQVITSLLRLQSHELDDEKSRHHFEDSVNRISAMALIHEKMYQSESLTQIDLKEYLEELIKDLLSSYSNDDSIMATIKSNIKDIDPKTLIPLALIFNELVSNSLEHGFSKRKGGEIIVNAVQNKDDSVTIDYKDDGEWILPAKKTSFGLELIQTFTEQLDGNVTRNVDRGTHYRFEFSKLLNL